MEKEYKYIGGIGNYYGGLNLQNDNGQWQWSIESYDGDDWTNIPDYLAEALIRYEKERLSKADTIT